MEPLTLEEVKKYLRENLKVFTSVNSDYEDYVSVRTEIYLDGEMIDSSENETRIQR